MRFVRLGEGVGGEILYPCNALEKRVLMVIDLQYFSHISLFVCFISTTVA